ncbi:sarcoplasmic/endoplasmic reticulum calcium ATPase regulator DWORF-like [Acipenser ruthenus]|nr:sarcoplasmic/endoplasmic reticulum calcium ATPase regulator DWORF-like [Acipenser ruthenus]
MGNSGQMNASRLVMPVLLMVGWIVGCVVVVYFVFS